MYSPWLRSNVSIAVRLAVVLMLLAAFFFPDSEKGHAGIHAAVLIDQSTGENSQAAIDRLAMDIGPETSYAIDRITQGVAAAIRNALWKFDPESQGVIVVASDRHWDHDALTVSRLASAAGIPVYWLPVEPDTDATKIIRIRAPHRARPGERITVSVDVQTAQTINVVLLHNGKSEAHKSAFKSGTVTFWTIAPDSGILTLGAEARHPTTDQILTSSRIGALVNIMGPPKILVISTRPSVFAESLRDGGWPVTELPPRVFVAQNETFRPYAAVVLDDVAIRDLPDSVWSELVNKVRQDATGLLVFGGPNSFGLGAYRESQLESLLPVISEPPDNQPPANLIFLVDVSGSMDRSGSTHRRLQIARQAVLETAEALRPVDRVGLMTFDIEARLLLPVEARPNHVTTMGQVWPKTASGGTRLMPALSQAMAHLKQFDGEQNLLVLLTDGALEGNEVSQLERVLRDTDVGVIAMLVDDHIHSDTSQELRFADPGAGRIIPVDDVLRLPVLMRSEIESRRPAVVSKRSRTELGSQASWLPSDLSWPSVDAYSLTRARDDALVHLTTHNGDVLIADTNAGAGRVVVVASSLSGWAREWVRWPIWPEVAASLTNYIAATNSGDVKINVLQHSNSKSELHVELADRKILDVDYSGSLIGPSGDVATIDLQSWSPGILGAELKLGDIGKYSLTVDVGSSTTRHQFLNHLDLARQRSKTTDVQSWVDKGHVQLLEPNSLATLADASSWRIRLIIFALLTYLLLLLTERLPGRSAGDV